MAKKNIFSSIINALFKKILSVPENKSFELGNPKRFIIIRQHNQLGDLLASVPLFRAIKEKYPQSEITVVLSPVNYQGLTKNKYIDRIFIFDKKKLFNPAYFNEFHHLLGESYDVVIVPVVVSVSFTSNLISRLASAKVRIGPASLDGRKNESSYFFDRRIDIDWRKHPDSNVSERGVDIVRPFGITTNNFRSEISFDNNDSDTAEQFISELQKKPGDYLIGLHVGAGKVQNRWGLEKYVELIKRLNNFHTSKFYLTGSNADKEELDFVSANSSIPLKSFINRKIPEVAALVSKSDLFISNDTGIMHVAGTTETPQVSIFGPTNPFNWAPLGENKLFIRKSDLIDDVTVDDVFELCKELLEKKMVE